MTDTLNVKIILGSTRPKRISEHLTPWVLEQVKKAGGIEAEVLDLRDYPMPFYDEAVTPSGIKDGNYEKDVVKKWAQKIEEADGYIIITPEYNHSIPAVLKNALDYVYYPWNKKAVGFVAYGTVGGARAVEHLRGVAAELQMVSARVVVHIPAPWSLQDESGAFKPGALEPFEGAAKGMLEQLIWWGKAAKGARAEEK